MVLYSISKCKFNICDRLNRKVTVVKEFIKVVLCYTLVFIVSGRNIILSKSG